MTAESNTTVVTRFAPSPTGALHVGGARTALFNWAYARKHNGKFILRVEDTDQARSTDASMRSILQDLDWLGIDWDEGPDLDSDDPEIFQKGGNGPYFQSQRRDIYIEHLHRLIKAGRAYPCAKTPAELKAAKDAAQAEKRNDKYDRTESYNLYQANPEIVQQYKADDTPFVWRFLIQDEDLTVIDEVRGHVTVSADEQEDFVIFKADGYPTYHFAVTVDDATMGVTHIIRGQEHLNNTPKHWALQDALGFDHPTYGHLGLIFNVDGSKMSKRDKSKVARAAAKAHIKEHDNEDQFIQRCIERDTSVTKLWNTVHPDDTKEPISEDLLRQFLKKKNDDMDATNTIADYLKLSLPEIDVSDFKKSGYLPSALCNYLALLGWNPGGDVEKFDNAFLAKHFDLDRVGKSNSKFDRDKLFSFNGDAIKGMQIEDFTAAWFAYCDEHASEYLDNLNTPAFADLAAAYHERSRTLAEPCEKARFFIEDPVQDIFDVEKKTAKKFLYKNDYEGLKILGELEDAFNQINSWSGEAAHEVIIEIAKEYEDKLGRVAQPLRIAISGGTVTPPIDITLNILGKDKTIRRIAACHAYHLGKE